MMQGQRINYLSVKDTDLIMQLAVNRMTDAQIVTFFKRRGRDVRLDDVHRVCKEMRVFGSAPSVGVPMFVEQFTREVYAKRREESARHLKEQECAEARRLLASFGAPPWVRDIVVECAAVLGVSPLAVAGNSRRRAVVAAREAALYEVCSKRSAFISIPRVGHWFGRDHSSVLYSIAKQAETYGLPKLTRFDLPRRRATAIEWNRRRRPQSTGDRK